jgi:phage virion morphogenesis protein
MAIALAMKLDGHLRVEKQLRAIADGLEERDELMDAIGLYLESSTLDRFDDETAPDGTPWKKSFRAKEQGGKTLTDQGLLKGSIAYIATNDNVEWGSNLIYARPHQEGATITAKGGGRLTFRLPGNLGFRSVLSVTLPARPFLGINGEDEYQILGLAEDYAAGLAGEPGQ